MYLLLAALAALCVACGLGARRARRLRVSAADTGASALEWAVISAIVVTAAIAIGAIVINVVNDKKDQVTACSNDAGTTNTCNK